LDKCQSNLEDCKDDITKSYVQYRIENKVANLSAMLNIQRYTSQDKREEPPIYVDKVLNMLLSPQCQLTLIKEIKDVAKDISADEQHHVVSALLKNNH